MKLALRPIFNFTSEVRKKLENVLTFFSSWKSLIENNNSIIWFGNVNQLFDSFCIIEIDKTNPHSHSPTVIIFLLLAFYQSAVYFLTNEFHCYYLIPSPLSHSFFLVLRSFVFPTSRQIKVKDICVYQLQFALWSWKFAPFNFIYLYCST